MRAEKTFHNFLIKFSEKAQNSFVNLFEIKTKFSGASIGSFIVFWDSLENQFDLPRKIWTNIVFQLELIFEELFVVF